MNTAKVFFIGDAALDEYYQAEYFPKLKDKVIVKTLKPEMGGMIANAACVFNALGGNTGFMAALNSGHISKQLCAGLNKTGIDIRYMTWDDSLPDSKTIIILAENEHTVFIPTMNLQKFELRDDAFNAILNSGYVFSNICELKPLKYKDMAVKEILDALKQHNVKLWCDIDVADIGDEDNFFFNYIDTVFMNETGREKLEKKYKDKINDILISYNINRIIVTEAEKGCSIYSKGEEIVKIKGVKVDVKDVTGAGDTFCSAFLFSFIKTNDVLLSGSFANYAAARAVTGKGARYGATDVKTVLEFVEQAGGNPKMFECLL